MVIFTCSDTINTSWPRKRRDDGGGCGGGSDNSAGGGGGGCGDGGGGASTCCFQDTFWIKILGLEILLSCYMFISRVYNNNFKFCLNFHILNQWLGMFVPESDR